MQVTISPDQALVKDNWILIFTLIELARRAQWMMLRLECNQAKHDEEMALRAEKDFEGEEMDVTGALATIRDRREPHGSFGERGAQRGLEFRDKR